MSLVNWIKHYKHLIKPDMLANNPNPKLLPYLEKNPCMIDWVNLSKNSNAIQILKENTSFIDWKTVCLNPHPEAMELIQGHYDHYLKRWKDNKSRRMPYDMVLSWENLSQNPRAIKFLKKNPRYTNWYYQEPPYEANQDDADYESEYLKNLYPDNEIHWGFLSANKKAVKLLKKKPHNIEWDWLSSNTSKKAIQLLEENTDKINWYWLSQNPSAIHLIEQNLDKVDWRQLCKNPNALHLFENEDNIIEVDWSYLSANPNALWLLEQYRSKIDWRWLCKNPNAGEWLGQNIETQFDKFDWGWLSENPCIFY